ncbi:transaldolase [Fischerella thermalis CCMEE 5330]|uniref:Transaldolase n=1 Tax=Fischerella thermalis CCMEE 5330 TaxID=2019670 RepID=A0A2N6LVL6_9CYAN|nr:MULTISPECIES: transaldolase [Fischerella]PMB38561.1 transaldolase [Fischerella thermalis CCMEE 5330]BAU06158.1 transaldolase/EF-hand domain-containing protein [Fischerella sp. NIES-3754]BCX08445.1 MAG: transaldolase [Fischerella sp.]
MSKTWLEQLQQITVVVADARDIRAIENLKPQDAITNPALITAAAQMPEYKDIFHQTLLQAKQDAGAGATIDQIVSLAVDRLLVWFGQKILQTITGRISTQVDARLCYDTEAIIAKARYLVSLYEANNISRERILMKIASTWEGIRAAEVLEKEGIHCHLNLLFGIHQAIACAEAGVTLVSTLVGRIGDWFKKESGREFYPAARDPGVLSVSQFYNYYKKFGYQTQIMVAGFRNIDQIAELAGCDLLAISPVLLKKLQSTTGELPRQLVPAHAAEAHFRKIHIDKYTFYNMHEADRMAYQKLEEGIVGMSKTLVALEQLLAQWLECLENKYINSCSCLSLGNIFRVYDFDGDGFISREEWTGIDAVFDALDVNHDGIITPEEMAGGLGAAFHLSFNSLGFANKSYEMKNL